MQPGQKPPDCIGRYMVTKHSWRGTYPRVMAITLTAVHTQDPGRALALTNSYSLVGDSPDIDGISLGPDPQDFTLSARQDARVSPGQQPGFVGAGSGQLERGTRDGSAGACGAR